MISLILIKLKSNEIILIQMQEIDEQMLLDENIPSSDQNLGTQCSTKQLTVATDRIPMTPGSPEGNGCTESATFNTPQIVESVYSPDIKVNYQQTTPDKIGGGLSAAKAAQITGEDETTGLMSSIGLAISSFFTGKAASPEKQTPQKGEADQVMYSELENTTEKSKLNGVTPQPVSNSFADNVMRLNEEHREKYQKQEDSDFEQSLKTSESDEANAGSNRASFVEEDGQARQVRQIGSLVNLKRQRSQKIEARSRKAKIKPQGLFATQRTGIKVQQISREPSPSDDIPGQMAHQMAKKYAEHQLKKTQSSFSIPESIGTPQRNKLMKTKSQQTNQLKRRGHSKTTYMSAQDVAQLQKRLSNKIERSNPLIQGEVKNRQQAPEAPLKEVSNIVFNQDRSHFAVLWTDGGFTKFDVASLQVLQQVYKTPEPDLSGSEQDSLEKSERQSGLLRQSQSYFWRKKQMDQEDDTKSKAEIFRCVALQHKTKDYVATLENKPKQAIFVRMKHEEVVRKPDQSGNPLYLPQQTKEQMYGRRANVRHFTEEINQIEILPGAKYTIFSLETKIYVYSNNSKDLYDIIDCVNPTVYSSIIKQLDDKPMLAYLDPSGDAEVVKIRDYGGTAECTYVINQPFGWGYKVGGLQLDVGGNRLCVVSTDGCYVYVFGLHEETFNEDTIQEIEEEDEQFLTPHSDENPYLLQEFVKKVVEITVPMQKFQRGSSACKDIYMPIQFVHGFTTLEYQRDFLLMSSSSMTTHFFVLTEETDEEKETRLKSGQQSWYSLSRILPSGLTLDRSAIRLNVQEEVLPICDFS